MKKSTVRAVINMVNTQLNVRMFDRVINDILNAKIFLENPIELENVIDRLMFLDTCLKSLNLVSELLTPNEKESLVLSILLYPQKDIVPIYSPQNLSESIWESYFTLVSKDVRENVIKTLTRLDSETWVDNPAITKILKIVVIGPLVFEEVLESLVRQETDNFMQGWGCRNITQVEDHIVLSTFQQLEQKYGVNGTVWDELQSLLPAVVFTSKKADFIAEYRSKDDILKYILSVLDNVIKIVRA